MTAEERAAKVKLIILDVDGVLTDGSIYVDEEKEFFKGFFARDGLGITIAQKLGLKTAIITGRTSPPVTYRASELHISKVYQGSLDKRAAYSALKEELGLTDEEIAYIGDDLVDLPILRQVGFPTAVGDAVPEVKAVAAYTAHLPGGHGAVREIIEFILKAEGLWKDALALYGESPTDTIAGLAQ